MLRHRGFSLIETLVALAIVAVLATLAYPGYAKVLTRARRGDAIARLLEVQQAQERWRANHAAYATLDDLSLPAAAVDPAYRLSITENDATGYTVWAEAAGPQVGDVQCRVMQLSMRAGQTELASGPSASAMSGGAASRRCWHR